jgi:hypothetical protein
MDDQKKNKNESGSAMIIMVATIAVLSVIGYILGSLISRHQESIPVNMDSARAFAIAQSGVEYVGKYLEGANFTTVANPSTKTLGTGTFGTAFSGATTSQITATITGVSGTATRRLTVKYEKKGGAILSRGPINPMNNPNGTVVCDAATSCNTATIHTCECTRENVPASVIPDIPVPSPQPAAPVTNPVLADPCNVGNHTINTSITAGTYFCPTYAIGQNSTLTLSGTVIIFCNTFNIGNLAFLNWSGSAANLVIIASSSVSVGQNVNLKGAIYAPGATVYMDNSATVTGMLVGSVVSVSNHYTVNYDPTAGSNTPYNPTISALAAAIDWKDI